MDCNAPLLSRRHNEHGFSRRNKPESKLTWISRSNNDQTSRQANKEVVAATLRCTENSSSIKAFKIDAGPRATSTPQRHFRFAAETIRHQLQIAGCTQGSAHLLSPRSHGARGSVKNIHPNIAGKWIRTSVAPLDTQERSVPRAAAADLDPAQ